MDRTGPEVLLNDEKICREADIDFQLSVCFEVAQVSKDGLKGRSRRMLLFTFHALES